MTSQLKIRCLLKTTAKKLWTRQRGEEKSHVLRKEEEGVCVCVCACVTGSLSLRLKESVDQQEIL